MSQLIESIKCLNGKLHNLIYHQNRLDKSYRALYHKEDIPFRLSSILIPKEYQKGLFKFRFIYDHMGCTYEWVPYQKKNIHSLKLVDAGQMSYAHKFVDRSELSDLFDQRGNNDDIIIIKEGLVTDSYYANLAFYRDSTWYTPAIPLLRGTKRMKLIHEGILNSIDIRKSDLASFEKVSLINAMLELGEIELPIQHIF